MPAKWFICPDGQRQEIDACLSCRGCRMPQRCATRAYLRAVSTDRVKAAAERLVRHSSAGDGPRYLYLKHIHPYAVNPDERAFALHGTAVHGKLALDDFTENILGEEALSDDLMRGTADFLEESEHVPGSYELSDYKTWGSFKVCKVLGMIERTEHVLDADGAPVVYKSGEKKGQEKTRKVWLLEPETADIKALAYQENRYRIFFEKIGFPVHRMYAFAIVRDGATYIAQNRGIDRRTYCINVPRLEDAAVLDYYATLRAEVQEGLGTGWVRRCNDWESWGGRRCDGYCEVADECRTMKAHC